MSERGEKRPIDEASSDRSDGDESDDVEEPRSALSVR